MFGIVAFAAALGLGYSGGRLHRKRLRIAPVSEPTMLVGHAETLREIILTVEGSISPEVEQALVRFVTPPLKILQSNQEIEDAWEHFWAEFAPESDAERGLALLRIWANRIRWTAKKRAKVIDLYKTASWRAKASEVINHAMGV